MGKWCDEADPENLLGGDRVVWIKGINYGDRQEAIKDAIRAGRSRLPSGVVRTHAYLMHERDNAADPNACAVLLGANIVGYLPRELAAVVAPVLDTFDGVPTCRAVVKRVKDGKRLVALVGPWPAAFGSAPDDAIADALESAEAATVRTDWTDAIAGGPTLSFEAIGAGLAERRAELARLYAQAATFPPAERTELEAMLAESAHQLAEAEAEHARQSALRTAQSQQTYPAQQVQGWPPPQQPYGQPHAWPGPQAPPAAPRPKSDSGVTGCLLLFLGLLFLGACAIGALKACVDTVSHTTLDAGAEASVEAEAEAPVSVEQLPDAPKKTKRSK